MENQKTVSLKKAHRIIQQLREELNSIELKLVYDVNIYSEVRASDFLNERKLLLSENLNKKLGIVALIFKIRSLIQSANEKEGINLLIGTRKQVMEQIAIVKPLLAKKEDLRRSRYGLGSDSSAAGMVFTGSTLQNTINARISAEGEKKETIHVDILDEVEISMLKKKLASLTRSLDDCNDALAEKNATIKIDLEGIRFWNVELFDDLDDDLELLHVFGE